MHDKPKISGQQVLLAQVLNQSLCGQWYKPSSMTLAVFPIPVHAVVGSQSLPTITSRSNYTYRLDRTLATAEAVYINH